jgi:hypothetical protein
MLFPYTYVPHSMEKMHEFIEYIFFKVWCKAPEGKPFSFELFNAKSELKAIMEAFHYSDSKGADFFNGHIEKIYGLFAPLSNEQISRLQEWFKGNNDIEGLCRNDPAVAIARYNELAAFHKPISDEMASFYKGLYSKDLLDLKKLRPVIGEMDDHHTRFTEVNKEGKCPFCGINDVKGIYQSKREAYDHYLPKGKYPFNSINFYNLAPACHECNSSYKTSKDPLYDGNDPLTDNAGGRRKAFYPYQTTPYNIDLNISLDSPDWNNIKPEAINIITGPEALREEIDTWMDVYGIEERYKAKCCGENDGKYWIESVLDEWINAGRLPEEYMATLERHTRFKPFAEANFLKRPFLEACRRAGLFD